MITIIPDVPENIAAFKASGEITEKDFENLVTPHVKAKVNTFNELNYLFLVSGCFAGIEKFRKLEQSCNCNRQKSGAEFYSNFQRGNAWRI